MKKIQIKTIIPYSLSLLLAAGGIYFRENIDYAKLLFIASVSIIVIPIIFKLILKYVVNEILSLVSSKGMKIHYDGNRDIAKSIYEYACNHGGTIISTHIFQQRVTPEDDFAYNAFKSGLDKQITFKRALIFSNKQEEQDWLNSFYSIDNKNLDFTAYVWKNVDFTNNNTMISLIPRFNFLLYKDIEEKEFKILVGFERIRTRDNFLTKRLNFGISFSSKQVYNALSKYFDNIVRHPEIEKITDKYSLQQYQYDFVHTPSEQFAIKDLIEFAYTNKSVLHLGAFGKTAILLKNLTKIRGRVNHQSDIDLLFVIQGSKEDFKKQILNHCDKYNFDTEIVFGDNEEYFYEFRKPGSVLIDIEIFEKDSNFYKIHQLLGYSIFHHYFNLFTITGKTLDELIYIPTKPIRLSGRKSLLIKNRKSISEFIDKISSCQDNSIDLRRVVTINLINLNWVITGFRSGDVETAIDYLYFTKVISESDNEFITSLLDMSAKELNSKYSDYKIKSLELLKKMREYANSLK